MKNLIKNVIRSFKNNKISLVGLIFLLFFGLGTFCIMSNTTANITNQYNSIAKKGNLHDFTASELYEIGNAAYLTSANGFEYKLNTRAGTPTITKVDSLGKLSTELYSIATTPIEVGTYYYIVPTQEKTEFSETGEVVYTRSYQFKLDANASTGLYKDFAQTGSKSYTEFEIIVNESVKSGQTPSATATAIETLQAESSWTAESMRDVADANPLAYDYNYFLKGMSDRTNLIFNIMTTKDTPLTKKLDQDYSKEISYRQFKSINVTATKDNIFYKVINANPTDTIDKIVLFKDPNGQYGNNLFNSTDWAPYNSQLKFYTFDGQVVKPGTEYQPFTVPSTFEQLVVMPLVSYQKMVDDQWTTDEKFIYSQMVHIRFKRMFAGDRSSVNDTVESLLTTLSAINTDNASYYKDFVDSESEIYQAYDDYLGYMVSWNENIIISLNGNIVINWSVPTPLTCTLVNWTSHFSIVNSQHLEATNKHVIDAKWLNDFEPFKEWCRIVKGYSAPAKSIDQNLVMEWFNSLSNAQFNFWWRPSTFSSTNEMEYIIYNKDGSIAKTIKVIKGVQPGQWDGVPDESIASCGEYYQIIWGCGLSPDFMYPVVDITRPTPNVKTECLTYVNDAGYKSLKLAFFNSPVEDFLIAKFMPSVTSTRQQEIINELNTFCAEKMLYPKEIKAVYRSNDTANVLNSSAFRVSYIPNLVSVIGLVSTILCSFLGILALIICLIIIKRYVENNRVNIGIMRANGISKIKIALSLFPFALLPALVGGIGAYLVGLFLQIPMLKLFGNYWTLPTPILGFDWVSMITCIFLPFLLFGVVTIIATLWVLRTSSVDLMKAGSEFKTNSFSKVAKKPFKHFGILTRFRVALAFNSLSRLIVLALMSCLTMTSLVFAMTSFGKLNRSQIINSSQFDYSFNLKLTTPTTAGGNYNVEDWSAKVTPFGEQYRGLGYTNESEYIYNVTWNTQGDYKSQNLTKWYSSNLLTVLDLWESYRTAIGNNGNLMLPTAADAIGQKQDLQYLMNKTCSKLTLDYVVGLGSLSSNPWEIAIALMPANARNTASDAYNKIVTKIGTKIDAGDTKWTKYRDYFEQDSEGKLVQPYQMSIDTKSWLSKFDADYAEFLVKIYTDPELMQDEFRISYGIIPTNWNNSTPTKKDELYTYITGNFKSLSTRQRPTFDPSHEITIEGITDYSDYIRLTSSNGEDLNKVLRETPSEEGFEWVIVNAFAAHKYNLNVGSTFEINMTNMVDRYDRQMHPEQFEKAGAKSSVAKFKVLAISQGTNGEAFYCKQQPANKLLGLPDGENWNSTHKYMLWQDYNTLANNPLRLIDLSCQGASDDSHYAVYAVDSATGKLVKEHDEVFRFNWITPVGFNGIYTADKSGKPLTSGLSLYSYSGLYPGSSVFESDSFKTLLSYTNNLPLANYMTGINDDAINDAYVNYITGKISKAQYMQSGVQPFVDLLRKFYGDTTMVTSICGATDVAASDLIYKNLITTFNLAETSIMSVVIPITIIVVGIISNLIINDSKKMAAMLKALGYSDRKNAMSILALFVPTIILGLALAIPASIGITTGYQALIFSNANILIDVTRKWWYYLASIGGIGVVLVATYVVGWASLKRDRLVDAIKR